MRPKIPSIINNIDKKPIWWRFVITLCFVAITAIATLCIPIIAERAAFLLFFFTIVQTAFWLGLESGFLALILTLIVADTLVLPPGKIDVYSDLILNVGFSMVSSIMIATASYHRRITAALLVSQQDLHLAQAVGQIGSWRINISDNKIIWSAENHRIFGVPEGTAMSYETFLSVVHPDDREFVDQMWQAAQRGDPYDIEHRVIVAGEEKWLRERAILEFDNVGTLLSGFGTTQDITKRKRNEQTLLESQQRYSGILESAMDAIIIINSAQRIMFFNSAAEHMFDCSAKEAMGDTITRFIPERYRNQHLSHINAFKDTGVTSRKMGSVMIAYGLRNNGEEFPLEASISSMGSEGDKYFTAIIRDITQSKLAEAALQNQLKLQDQLAKVAVSAPGLICSFRLHADGSASMPYASPVINAIYGFTPEEVAKDFSPVFARMHPDDIAYINASIAESARSLQPWHAGYRYNHPYKGEIWHEGHSIPLQEENGDMIWHGYIQDVTGHVVSEKALQERIERYELVLDGAQDAIWDWDIPNKRVHFSSRWKALRGYTDNEIGDSEEIWSSSIYPEDTERVFKAITAHFEGKTEFFCEEYRVRRKDGSWIWVLDRGLAKKNADGIIVRMAGSESDITARKLAEAALREQERALRLIMNATPALISYMSPDFRYLRLNKSYENWFGISEDHILGHECQEIVGDKAWVIIRPYLEKARSGETVNFDYQIPYGNASPRWVNANYIPDLDANGTVKGIVIFVIDIEDRKQTEQKIIQLNKDLQNKLEEMHVIFNTTPIGLAIAEDTTGLHIRGNRANEQLLGLPSNSELSKKAEKPVNYLLYQNGKLLDVENLPMQRAIRGELVSNQILDVFRADGKIVTLLSNASPLFNDSGEPRGAIGTFLDITALKQAEKSLIKSQNQLRLLIEQAPISIAMLDRDFNYLVTSARWTNHFGRGHNDLTGLNHYEVYPDLPDRWKQTLQQALNGMHLKNDQDSWPQSDGSIQWLRWAVYPWTNQSGEISGIILSLEDITAQQLAQEDLRTAQARLALIVEELRAGYWDWDLTTHKLYFSPEWKQQIGISHTEKLDCWEDWAARLHPQDRESVSLALDDYIHERQQLFEIEFRLLHQDHSYRWIHSRGVLLRDQNNLPYRMLGINLDVTDYKKALEFNQERDDMEQLYRQHLATQTAAAIAHELNQPLTAISSYADVALDMLQKGNPAPEKLLHILKSCTQQAQRAGEFIHQLMAVLQKDEIEHEAIDINKLIYESLVFIKQSRLKETKIKLELTPELPLIAANSVQVQKVLINLLRNALESVDGSINASLLITITTARDNDPAFLHVIVRDNGKGVSDDTTLKTIFQPFYTTKPSGLGMGLAVSRALIEGHFGKMWAEDNADSGISMHFTLPFIL